MGLFNKNLIRVRITIEHDGENWKAKTDKYDYPIVYHAQTPREARVKLIRKIIAYLNRKPSDESIVTFVKGVDGKWGSMEGDTEKQSAA